MAAETGHGSGRARDVVAAISGFPIGILSGFTGVGGGEYRAPVLLVLLKNIRFAISANLLAGILVSAFVIALRGGASLPPDALLLAAVMISASVPGGYLGAIVARRTSVRWLKGILAAILVVTAVRLLVVETVTPGVRAFGVFEAGVALLVGFGIGTTSGLLGLAGGEYRIPALILLFGVPTVLAGTLSSLVALPQLAVAFWKHHRLKQTGRDTLRLGGIMGLAGIAGVAVGVFYLGRTNDVTVVQVLGAVMLAAAARIAWEIRRPEPPGRGPSGQRL